MVELRLYPSGFRGSALVRNTAPIDMEHNRNRMFSSSAITSPEGRSASLEVCQIWEAVTNGEDVVKTFEFKERVISVAKKVFGADYLYDWLVAQRKSPNWDEYHCRWIDETLGFVFLERPRELSPHNWVALLAAAGQDSANRDSRVVNDVFFATMRIGDAFTMDDFLLRWVRQTGGVDDLTNSLYVLFGGR